MGLAYEALSLAAVLWAAALLYSVLERHFGGAHARALFQAYLIAVTGVYFIPQWVRGGQTLAMKTWRLRLVRQAGGPVSVQQALARYLAALLGVLLFGAGYLWAFVDPERQFLHDRIARTRIVR